MHPWILCWKKIDEIGVPEVITICLIGWRVKVGPGLSEECSRSFSLKVHGTRVKTSFPKWACTQTRAFHGSLSLHVRRLSCTTVFLMRLSSSLSALWPHIRHRLTNTLVNRMILAMRSEAWNPGTSYFKSRSRKVLELMSAVSFLLLIHSAEMKRPSHFLEMLIKSPITQKCYRSSVTI